MDAAARIETLGALVGEKARAAILIGLIDGSSRPAGELAFLANVSRQSASTHLAKLVHGGLLNVVKIGRHRYYRIASSAIAHAVEALAAAVPPPVRLQQEVFQPLAELSFARRCYDHLAGRVAVDLADALQHRGFLRPTEGGYEATPTGEKWFGQLGIDVKTLQRKRRAFALACLDWTVRRYHIAGALGATLLRRMLELGWVAQSRRSRVMRITVEGKLALNQRLKMNLP